MSFIRFMGAVSETFDEGAPVGKWAVWPFEWKGGAPTGVGAGWFYPFSGSADGYVKNYWVIKSLEADITVSLPGLPSPFNFVLQLEDVTVTDESQLMETSPPNERHFYGSREFTDDEVDEEGDSVLFEVTVRMFLSDSFVYQIPESDPSLSYAVNRLFWANTDTAYPSIYIAASADVEASVEGLSARRSHPLTTWDVGSSMDVTTPTAELFDVLSGNGGGDVQMYDYDDSTFTGSSWEITIYPKLWFEHGGKWDETTGTLNPGFIPPY